MNNLLNKKILVTGGEGFLGKAVIANLQSKGISREFISITKYPEDDLRDFQTCLRVTKDVDFVIHLAAKVGGILFNKKHPGSMMFDNIMMGFNILEACRLNAVEKVVLFGTTCSYPENAPIPFKEEDLWNGYPAEVTAPYGIAKKTIHELAKGYKKEYGLNSIFLLPVNLYGPGDNFIKEDAHVIPALIQRFVEAAETNMKEVTVWGTGKATREFLYIEDAAEGISLALKSFNETDAVNLGTGVETSIRDIAELIRKYSGYSGEIVWDQTKPDGTPRRQLEVSKAKKLFGFVAKTDIQVGLKKTVEWYKCNIFSEP